MMLPMKGLLSHKGYLHYFSIGLLEQQPVNITQQLDPILDDQIEFKGVFICSVIETILTLRWDT